MATNLREGADGPAHGFIGHTHEAHGHLLHRQALQGTGGGGDTDVIGIGVTGVTSSAGGEGSDVGGHGLERPCHCVPAQGLVLARAEDPWEVLREESAEAEVGISDGQWTP